MRLDDGAPDLVHVTCCVGFDFPNEEFVPFLKDGEFVFEFINPISWE